VGSLAAYRAGPPGLATGRANVIGSLDKAIIRRVIRRHINEWRYCYERELQPNPSLSGRIITRFTIGPTGRVLTSRIEESTVGNAAVERCVAQALRRWRFPAPRGGGIVVVSYPVVFHAAGD
jgi:TonB family protein